MCKNPDPETCWPNFTETSWLLTGGITVPLHTICHW